MKPSYQKLIHRPALIAWMLLLCACGGEEKQLFNNPFSFALLTIPELFKYDFGSVPIQSSPEKVFTILNDGKRDASQISVTFTISAFSFKGGSFPGTGGTCQDTLAPKAQCTIVVVFSPQYADDFSEFINLSYFNGERMDLVPAVQLLGKGIAGTSGSLDTTFQGTGTGALRVGTGNTTARQVAPLSDGKILVAGNTFESGSWNFFVVRLLPDGQIDTSFAFNGVSVNDFSGGDDFATSLLVQPDGKIIVAGRSFSGGKFQFAFWRLTAQGMNDLAFGVQGSLLVSVGGSDAFLQSTALQTDGSIVGVGYATSGTQYDFAAVRVLSNSSLDGSFGTGGKVLIPVGTADARANAVAVQPDGKIVLAGVANNGQDEDMGVARLNSNGTMDMTFASGGKALIDFSASPDSAHAIAIQFDNKIVLGGQTGSPSQFSLVRLLPSGLLDGTFGVAGRVTTLVTSDEGAIDAIALQSDGRVVATGYTTIGTDRDVAITRYFLSGALDTSFANGGKGIYPMAGTQERAFHCAIANNSKILVVGESQSAQTVALLARIWP